MRHFLAPLFLLLAFLVGGIAFTGEKTTDLGWCTVTCPDKAGVGQKFTVTITVKDVPDGTKLAGDIHLVKPDGAYVGFGQWGGNPRAVKTGQPLAIVYTMPEAKDGSGGILIQYFLTAKGWNERVKEARTPAILLDATYVDPNARAATATLKKSWFTFGKARKGENSSAGETWTEGDDMIVPVTYYVDPSDDWGGTELLLWVMGPWVDCPDGVYTKARSHLNYPGLNKNLKCEIGKETAHEFHIKMPKPYISAAPEEGKVGDSLLLIGLFKGKDGKPWPWQVRLGGPNAIARKNGFFELDAPCPGNLFLYGQPVTINAILGNAAAGSGEKQMTYQVFNQQGKRITDGSVNIPAAQAGQTIALPLQLSERGTFRIRASVDGWETRETTFATIPALHTIIGDEPTPFGCQKIAGNPEAVKAARMLGMSTCRVWTMWNTLEPQQGKWNQQGLDGLEAALKDLNANQIRPWLLFDGPPAWAVDSPKVWGTHFAPFPFRDADLASCVRHLATLYKDQISGFEWLNEIVPGKDTDNPVEDYLRFCRIATATVKQINPAFQNQLAGGLWPHSFRKSLLAAGIAPHIDILPVHYATRAGVEEAEADLQAVGAKDVAVWDNETTKGWSTWKMPLDKALADNQQSDYFMTRFPDELLAGCKQIVVFGGEPDPAGNWSHFWGDMSPRASAATLAVLTSKLAKAKPLGEFSLGRGDSLKLFQTPGRKAVLVISTVEKEGETVQLPTGGDMTATDQQGNETPLPAQNGMVRLALTQSPYFAEGGDLDILLAQLAVQFPGHGAGIPQLAFVKGGADAKVTLRLMNFYEVPLSGKVSLRTRTGESKAVAFELKASESKLLSLPVDVAALPEELQEAAVLADFTGGKLPQVQKKMLLNIISPDKVGNLLKNANFETAGETPQQAAHWDASGKNGQRVDFKEQAEPGHGDYVYQFTDTAGKYLSIWQGIDKPAEGEYVYSLWIKSQNLQTGSNFNLTEPSGKTNSLSWMHIFNAPATQQYWDVFTARVKVSAGTVSMSAAPVCNGKGSAWIDNASLTMYEGTVHNASAARAPGAITIDGNLLDFNRAAPIPLLGQSQLRVLNKGYSWTPANLSGAAWLNWDERNLYIGIEVIDDKQVADRKEGDCNQDDSVEVAIHPLNRQAGEDSKAFVYYLSATAPGGSGKHTIFRPADRSGGLKSGSLAKDSSTYDIVVKRVGNTTTYEVAIPFNDLGGILGSFGGKFGLSLALNDNDGAGKAATILWGEGLHPAWSPANFGMATLVGK